QPNYLARGLGGQRTKSIGIVWALCGPHDVGGVIQQLVQQAYCQGYTAHIAESLSDVSQMKSVLQDFSRRQLDGVILRLALDSDEACIDFFKEDIGFLRMMQRFHAVCLIS